MSGGGFFVPQLWSQAIVNRMIRRAGVLGGVVSTRAAFTFKDNRHRRGFTVYKHSDGHPAWAEQAIRNALAFAWQLPRFEADDFAAAFVRGNKGEGGGNVRLSTGYGTHPDLEYRYEVYFSSVAGLSVKAFKADGSRRFIAAAEEKINWKVIYDGGFEPFKDFIETKFVED